VRRRRIKEIGVSSRGRYIRNADIMPNWGDICSTADIPRYLQCGINRRKEHAKRHQTDVPEHPCLP